MRSRRGPRAARAIAQLRDPELPEQSDLKLARDEALKRYLEAGQEADWDELQRLNDLSPRRQRGPNIKSDTETRKRSEENGSENQDGPQSAAKKAPVKSAGQAENEAAPQPAQRSAERNPRRPRQAGPSRGQAHAPPKLARFEEAAHAGALMAAAAAKGIKMPKPRPASKGALPRSRARPTRPAGRRRFAAARHVGCRRPQDDRQGQSARLRHL